MPYHREPQTVRRAIPATMRARLDSLPPQDRMETLFARLLEKSRYFTRPHQQLAVTAISQWVAGRKRLKKHDRVIRYLTTEDWLSLVERVAQSVAEQTPQTVDKALVWLLIWLKDAE